MCFCCAIAHTVFVSCSFFAKTQELVIDIPGDNCGQSVDYWRVCLAGVGSWQSDEALQRDGGWQRDVALQTSAAPQNTPFLREYIIPAGGALLVDVPKNCAVSVLAYPKSDTDTALFQDEKPWVTIYPWYS